MDQIKVKFCNFGFTDFCVDKEKMSDTSASKVLAAWNCEGGKCFICEVR